MLERIVNQLLVRRIDFLMIGRLLQDRTENEGLERWLRIGYLEPVGVQHNQNLLRLVDKPQIQGL